MRLGKRMLCPWLSLATGRSRWIGEFPNSMRVLIASLIFLISLSPRVSQAAVDRPPQLVAIAFDNCTELERWSEIEQLLQKKNTDQPRMHFTFFVSGTNFLSELTRAKYQGPRHQPGYAMINFGGSPRDVEARVAYINRLHATGNEIASHAVGHFAGGHDGANWTRDEWRREFASFNALFDNVKSNNAIAASGFSFHSDRIVGFRAPLLSVNQAMYEVLHEFHYRYDTSLPDEKAVDTWPRRDPRGTWLFKLARIPIAGTRGPATTLSMDYNICGSQMQARGGRADCETALLDQEEVQALGKEMMETYRNYFRQNYMGNRAPIHLGHHFYAFQHGIYNKVLLTFAQEICAVPETLCVSYSKLADFMDKWDATVLAAYQRGDFDREGLQAPKLNIAPFQLAPTR